MRFSDHFRSTRPHATRPALSRSALDGWCFTPAARPDLDWSAWHADEPLASGPGSGVRAQYLVRETRRGENRPCLYVRGRIEGLGHACLGLRTWHLAILIEQEGLLGPELFAPTDGEACHEG